MKALALALTLFVAGTLSAQTRHPFDLVVTDSPVPVPLLAYPAVEEEYGT